MARKKKSYRKKNKAIPVLPAAAAIMPFMMGGGLAAAKSGNITGAVRETLYDYTGVGYWSDGTQSFNAAKPIAVGTGLFVGYVGHRVANKIGVNKTVRKLTMGFIEL